MSSDETKWPELRDPRLRLFDEGPENWPSMFADETLRNESGYSETGNFYFVLATFQMFVKERLYPPSWVMEALQERFDIHMKNPDPELIATQVGVMSRGSGSKAAYEEYEWHLGRLKVLDDLAVLLGGFDISSGLAAQAVIAKHQLAISPKRLVNEFIATYGPTKRLKFKHRKDSPFFSKEDRDKYLHTFPVSFRLLIKRKESSFGTR